MGTWRTAGLASRGRRLLSAAVAIVIGVAARMIQHENHAYKAIIDHTPVEKGPAAEGEPPVY